jgi:cell division protein FtsI (penicillin-binding protein 3)
MGNTVERFQAKVINPKMASDEAISKVRGMLEGVVLQGTGKLKIKNKLYSVAGKTGTAQIANGAAGYGSKSSHQASFCGYFPADKPKYSMIVVISNPTKGSHLAAWVAGPVFRKIADRVYANDLGINQQPAPVKFVGNTNPPKVKQGNVKALKQVYEKLGVKPLYASANTGIDTSAGISFEDVKYKTGTVPAVAGMSLSDALYTVMPVINRLCVVPARWPVNRCLPGMCYERDQKYLLSCDEIPERHIKGCSVYRTARQRRC